MINIMKYIILLATGLFLKLQILNSIGDTYFEYYPSIKLNRPVYRNKTIQPFATRVVIYAYDNLEDIFIHENKSGFLVTSARPQQPTLCQPGLGPDAVLTGISKDRSLLYTDLLANKSEIDSVLKQCNNAYFWGGSFNSQYGKDMSIETQVNPNGRQKMSHAREDHDAWILKQLRNKLKKRRNVTCGEFCDSGNIFIVNLLGMDAFPLLKKTDPEYFSKLVGVSKTVQKLTTEFDSFFKFDQETTYILLAKRGIMNCGLPRENDLLVIGWGAGIAENTEQHDMNQQDLAPFIATLLGVNIPFQSKGKLPVHFLKGTDQQKAAAMLVNIKQITNQFLDLYRYHFSHMPLDGLTAKDLYRIIQVTDAAYENQNYNELIKTGNEVIDICLESIQYNNGFNKMKNLTYVMVLFFLWCGCSLMYMKWRVNISLLFGLLLQIIILTLSYMDRRMMALAILVVAMWGMKTYKNLTTRLIKRWINSLTVISILLAAPVSTNYSVANFCITTVTFFIVSKTMFGEVYGVLVLTFSCINAAGISWLYTNGHVIPISFFITSNVLFSGCVKIVWQSNTSMINRFKAIACALFSIYIHMSRHREGIFFSALMVLLYTWMELELELMQPTDNASSVWELLPELYFDNCPKERSCISNGDLRRCVFLITFAIAGLFSADGATSTVLFFSANSYETNFRLLILIAKICVPMLLCSSAYIVILRLTRSNISKSFATLTLFCNSALFCFFFIIRNRSGSYNTWKDLNTSMSNAMVAVVLSGLFLFLTLLAFLVMCHMEQSQAARTSRLDRWRLVSSLRFKSIQFWNYYNNYTTED